MKPLLRVPIRREKSESHRGQRLTDNWPVLQFGTVPPMEASNWTLTISGLVDKERRLGYEEFMSLPQVTVFSDIHCVTTWSKLDNLWEGVSTAVIRQLTTILPEAQFVTIHSAEGFTTNLALSDFFEPDVLLAVKHNGEELTPEHGYPVRLVVPRLYFWKSSKWVVGIEFTAEDKPGFWESRGYHNHGDPWQEQRYSR